MSYREDLKRAMGGPLLDVELDEKADVNNRNVKDDYDWIEEQVLRKIRTYFPCEQILRKDLPAADSGAPGNGYIDMTNDDVLTIQEVYVIKNRMAMADVLLPWSLVRIWEKIWVGASEYVGADLLLYKNELAGLAKASDNVFWWKWYEAERKLYVCNIPSWGAGVGIVALSGVARLDLIDTRTIQYGLALDLGTSYAKIKIGQAMRKYSVEGMTMPGDKYVEEGEAKLKETMEKVEEFRHYPGGLA